MSNDPLAEVIARVLTAWDGWGSSVLAEALTDTFRAHLAAVLDAEEANWSMDGIDTDSECDGDIVIGVQDAIASIRTALGVAPTDREGG